MEQEKQELEVMIEHIEDEALLDYLLLFVESFSEKYNSTSAPEIEADT